MEARAPYGQPGPRNLASPLAEWLRTQGWVATEQALPAMHTVEAHWYGPQQERFELTYVWQAPPHGDATLRFRVLRYGQLPELLFSAQHVRRLKDARQLVTNCVRYANARLLAQAMPSH